MTEAIERYQEIEAHINFQKAILDDNDDGERFSRYLEILEGVKNGESPENPVDREIARILALAVEEELDPWEIDLVEFSKAYIKAIEKSDDVDFIVAGRIIFLAWSVLKKQSDATLSKAEGMENEEFFFEDWAPWEFEPYEEIDDISYTGRVVSSDEPPINKAIRYRTKRKVTLIELVDAFEEARKEADFREKIERIKKKAKRKEEVKMPNVEHKEDIEEEIKEVWERIINFGDDKMTLSSISKGTKEDFITVFVAILFLAHRNRIKIWQKGKGEIYIENIMPKDENGNILEPPVLLENSDISENSGKAEKIILSV
jgi:segregation and condensation protein A